MMQGTQFWLGMVFALSLCTTVQAGGETEQPRSLSDGSNAISQVIVQIGGRFCEYHRVEVEAALRRYQAVREVEFLNNHGTVLVRYQTDGVPVSQLAEAVEQALASSMGCKAWVDRGGQQSEKS
jgi:hypothetical protein